MVRQLCTCNYVMIMRHQRVATISNLMDGDYTVQYVFPGALYGDPGVLLQGDEPFRETS